MCAYSAAADAAEIKCALAENQTYDSVTIILMSKPLYYCQKHVYLKITSVHMCRRSREM